MCSTVKTKSNIFWKKKERGVVSVRHWFSTMAVPWKHLDYLIIGGYLDTTNGESNIVSVGCSLDFRSFRRSLKWLIPVCSQG